MKIETQIRLSIHRHDFSKETIDAIFEEFRASWGIGCQEYYIEKCPSNVNYFNIVILGQSINNPSSFDGMEATIQNKVNELSTLRYNLKLIQEDKNDQS